MLCADPTSNKAAVKLSIRVKTAINKQKIGKNSKANVSSVGSLNTSKVNCLQDRK